MASSGLIKVYKGKVLEPIFKRRKELGFNETKHQCDSFLKKNAQVDMSCIVMDYEQIMELILVSQVYGDKIGLDLHFPPSELDEMIDLNI